LKRLPLRPGGGREPNGKTGGPTLRRCGSGERLCLVRSELASNGDSIRTYHPDFGLAGSVAPRSRSQAPFGALGGALGADPAVVPTDFPDSAAIFRDLPRRDRVLGTERRLQRPTLVHTRARIALRKCKRRKRFCLRRLVFVNSLGEYPREDEATTCDCRDPNHVRLSGICRDLPQRNGARGALIWRPKVAPPVCAQGRTGTASQSILAPKGIQLRTRPGGRRPSIRLCPGAQEHFLHQFTCE
jgi:hypothetical protein